MSASPAQITWRSQHEEKLRNRTPVYKQAEILQEIVRLKKEKQGIPSSGPECDNEVDQLCLLQAFLGVATHFACDISVFSEHYAIPEDVLLAILTDWVVSKHFGCELTPIEFFGC